jgi:hypothetical protein
MGGWLQFGRGEVGWGRRRRNRGREDERVSVEAVCTGVYRWNHRWKYSVGITVGDFAGVSDTSLLGYPGLNPSVFLSVNSSEKNPRHPAVAIFKKNSRRRRCRRYIPTKLFRQYIPAASPTAFFHRLIPTDFETEIFPSVKISVGNSVGVIRFSGSD